MDTAHRKDHTEISNQSAAVAALRVKQAWQDYLSCGSTKAHKAYYDAVENLVQEVGEDLADDYVKVIGGEGI